MYIILYLILVYTIHTRFRWCLSNTFLRSIVTTPILLAMLIAMYRLSINKIDVQYLHCSDLQTIFELKLLTMVYIHIIKVFKPN